MSGKFITTSEAILYPEQKDQEVTVHCRRRRRLRGGELGRQEPDGAAKRDVHV